MRLKSILTNLLFLLTIGLIFPACENDIKNNEYQVERPRVDYEALRNYKKSDHQIMFGWFGGWDGGASASAVTMLMALPDSIDMVSIWGKWTGINELQKKDLAEVQKTKGTKVIACIFMPSIGAEITPEGENAKEYWGWVDGDYDKEVEAIGRYAKAIADTIVALGYDGLDIDNEPSGYFYGKTKYAPVFIAELGKYLGPKSGTGRLLCVDGYLTTGLLQESYEYIDYFICQAYYATSYSSLESGSNRFNTYSSFYNHVSREDAAKKYISTEDYERYAGSGGPDFRTRSGETVRGTIGHAGWNPLGSDGITETPKAGAGLYHIEYDYKDNNGPYHWVYEMIRTMNPPKK